MYMKWGREEEERARRGKEQGGEEHNPVTKVNDPRPHGILKSSKNRTRMIEN